MCRGLKGEPSRSGPVLHHRLSRSRIPPGNPMRIGQRMRHANRQQSRRSFLTPILHESPRPTDPPVDEDARYKVIPILTRDFFSVSPHLQAEPLKVRRPESDPKRKTRSGVAVKVSGRGFCQVLLYANHSCRKRASACHRDCLRSCHRPDTTAAKLGMKRNCHRLLPGRSTVACKGQNRKPRSNRFSRYRRGFPCLKRLRPPDSPAPAAMASRSRA